MKRFTKLMVAIAVVAMAIPAFSAVENIKVGGDIDIYGINRHNFNYLVPDYADDHFQTSARVYVQAQLTDNVEAMVRLINERDWGYGNCDCEQSILVDLAYIKVSGLGIDGLGLTVGRQEIQLGEGLVVGSRYTPYFNYPTGDTRIVAQDLGKQKAFDAIRLDYNGDGPVDATLFMAKIHEEFTTDDDHHLYGLNLGFDIKDTAKLEGYYVRYQNMNNIEANCTTIGIRATGNVGNFDLKGEYARQLGESYGGADNKGWACLLGGQYNFDAAVSGNVHANLNLYSGQDSSSDNTQWLSMFPANTATRIGAINYVLVTGNLGPTGLCNARVINLGAAVKPAEKLCLGIDWFNVNLLEETFWSSNEKAIGNEIDASVVYNHTDDLAFGLQYGILLTGDALAMFDANPWQLIASAKLAF